MDMERVADRYKKRSGKKRRWLVRAGYVFIALIFFAGFMSRYLPPHVFWWTSFLATILPYLSILLIAVTPLVLWKLRPAGRLVHSLLLLLIAGRFITLERIWDTEEPSEDDLVFMTFNAPVRGPHPDSLSSATLALVRKEKPDLLALQEPVLWLEGSPLRRRATAHVQAILDSLSYWAPTPSGRGKPYDLDQPVLSRFTVEDVRQYILRIAEGTDHPTYFTRTLFKFQNRQAVVYNVHLHTVGARKPWHENDPRFFDPRFWYPYLMRYREDYLRRVWEVRQLRNLVEQEHLPVIVTGDLNSTIHHWEYRHLAKGFKNAFDVGGKGWGATYHARLPLVRIDHILVSPEWQVVTASVRKEHAYSDHRPLVARLRWHTKNQ